MSQLSNKRSVKSIIIYLVILLVIVSLISLGAIYYINLNNKPSDIQNNIPNDDNNQTNINKKNEDNLKVKSLEDKFDNNAIKFETIVFNDGDTKINTSNEKEYKININYVSISGLVNTSIQDKINNDIKAKAYSLYNESYKTDKSIKSVYINTTINSNFADILSITISGSIGYSDNKTKTKYFDDIYLNYRLDTGEYFKFEDLFTCDAPILNIVSNALYERFAWSQVKDLEDVNMDEIDYGYFEDEVFKYTKFFEIDKKHDFCFTPKDISLVIPGLDTALSINMVNSWEYSAIYKRFVSDKTLYNDKNIGLKGSFVFTNRNSSSYSVYKDMSDNLFVTANVIEDSVFNNTNVIKNSSLTIGNNLLNNVQSTINNKIDEFKKIADNDKSNGYIYSIVSYIYENNKTSMYELNIIQGIYKIPLNYYKNNHNKILCDFERRPKSSIDEPIVTDSDAKKQNITKESKDIVVYFDSNGYIKSKT